MSPTTHPLVRIELLRLDQITPDPTQVRREFDDEALGQLADSITANGVIQPIVVRPTPPGPDGTLHLTPWQIIAGERRWRASARAGVDVIPAVIREDLSDESAAVLQVLENLQRADLTLPELSAGVSKLVTALGFDKACQQLGKSPAWVSKHSRIEQLDDAVKVLVTEGKVTSADLAHDLSQIQKLSQQLEFGGTYYRSNSLDRAAAGDLTRQTAREIIQRLQDDIRRESAQKKQRDERNARLNDDATQRKAREEEDRSRAQAEALHEAREARREHILQLRNAIPQHYQPLAEALTTSLTRFIGRRCIDS